MAHVESFNMTTRIVNINSGIESPVPDTERALSSIRANVNTLLYKHAVCGTSTLAGVKFSSISYKIYESSHFNFCKTFFYPMKISCYNYDILFVGGHLSIMIFYL